MIILVNPRATRPSNRRFPLSIMAIGAALPSGEDWEIVDGNLPGHRHRRAHHRIRHVTARHRRSGTRHCLHRDAGATTRQRCSAHQTCQSPPSRHPHYLGRQFRQSLSGAGAECALHRLVGPRPGRTDLRRIAGGAERHARSRDCRGTFVPQARRQPSHRRRAAVGRARRTACAALSQDRCARTICAPHFSASAPASIRLRSAVPMPAISAA